MMGRLVWCVTSLAEGHLVGWVVASPLNERQRVHTARAHAQTHEYMHLDVIQHAPYPPTRSAGHPARSCALLCANKVTRVYCGCA
jgi:hypothetical protein